MVSNTQASKRKKGAVAKRGKRQRTSAGVSPITTGDDESNSSGEVHNDGNRISVGVNVDADLLGPCEPGTEVVLEGIVWTETSMGVLVVNVTWKGRTYVGTLLNSSGESLNVFRPIKPAADEASTEDCKKKTPVPSKCNGTNDEPQQQQQPSAQEELHPVAQSVTKSEPYQQPAAPPPQNSEIGSSKPKSPIQQMQESTNPIQKLEFMTSNRINALQTQPSHMKPILGHSCAHIDQSPINALSSLIEDTSKSFEIDSRAQHSRYSGGGRKSVASAGWSRQHEHGANVGWMQRRPDVIAASGGPPVVCGGSLDPPTKGKQGMAAPDALSPVATGRFAADMCAAESMKTAAAAANAKNRSSTTELN